MDTNHKKNIPGTLEHLLTVIEPESQIKIIASLREGILVLGPDLRIIAVNPASETILGRSGPDLIGNPICSLLGDQSCPEDILLETLMSNRPIIDFQTTVQLPEGRVGHVLLRSVPLVQADGVPLGLALLLGDVSEETTLRKELSQRSRLGAMVGRDSRMRELFQLIVDVAASDASVLIRGESGTGKELVARAIHEHSNRTGGPFVQVNCSALSENLLESELFGHVKGAYTGAVNDRRGRFEEADGGTIFLDEIGDVSPVIQVKLLRVLQERTVERVGDNKQIPVNVRIVSATNRDLEQLLATGKMREDFFYRIKVVSLGIPPLRNRREDIQLLMTRIMEKIAAREQIVELPVVSAEAMAMFMNHSWPGNVRELENSLEHALVLSRGGAIMPSHLPPEMVSGASVGTLAEIPRNSKMERDRILEALGATGWNRTRAARKLNIDRTTLWRKIKEHDLTPDVE